MIINRIYENQNLLSLYLVSFLVELRTYQHPCTLIIHIIFGSRCSMKVKLLPCPIKIMLRRQVWAWRYSSTHS